MKTVFISGGATGIGNEMAKLFSQNNYNVAIGYKSSKNKALSLAKEIRSNGGKASACFCDVTNTESLNLIKKEVSDIFGDVDVLINNAGVSYENLITSIEEDEWDEIFNVNVKGTFMLSKIFLPAMIRNKFGRIINISSILGITGGSCEVHYSASKAALIGFTKALSKEVGPSQVTVNSIAPGLINTKMNERIDVDIIRSIVENTPIGRIGSSSDVAFLAKFLASDQASFITGQVISVDGGLYSI